MKVSSNQAQKRKPIISIFIHFFLEILADLVKETKQKLIICG